MKKAIFLSLLVLAFFAPKILSAQAATKHGTGDQGKTYYDAAKTKPKEIYSTKELTVADPDYPDSPMIYLRKDGPYFFYYENGKLEISGWYTDDAKSGQWKYYDDKGNLRKTENYVNGKVQN